MKIQWKIMYNRRTNSSNLEKNSNSLNVKIRENWMENQWRNQIMKSGCKIVCIRYIDSSDKLRNLISLIVQNYENSMGNYVQ